MTRASRGRLAAARALQQLEERGGHVDRVLEPLLADVQGPERGLAWTLVLGVERGRSLLDHQLAPHVSRPLASLDPGVRAVLRCAALQLLHLDRIPDHAAVDQAVRCTRPLGLGRAAGLVNAVLRSLLRDPDRAGVPRDESVRLSMPRWILDRIPPGGAAAFNERAPLALRPRVPDLGPSLESAGVEVLPGPGGALLVPGGGDPTALPGWEEGWFAVQDAAAQAVVDLLGARPGERVLDACAAPGGKALAIADRVGPDGIVVAQDVDGDRLARLEGEGRRLRVEGVELRVADARAPRRGELFDRVLVDAPCTALGTLRRHPEIRWQRRPGDPARMAERQREILEGAVAAVRPGGSVVYAVCTFAREEGRDVVAAVLAQHPELEPCPVSRRWGEARAGDGWFESWPRQAPWDAFQAAILRRRP